MLSFFIARRIFNEPGKKNRASRPAIRIATAGVAVGLAVMIVSVCVVLGFKHTIRDKVVGFGSHIQVADFMTLQGAGNYPVVMNDSMMRAMKRILGVTHVQRFATKEGILKTDNDFLGVIFKGVGPEWDSTFIHQNMVAGSIPKFDDKASHNKILISQNMADKLGLHVGDRIFAYFIDRGGVRTRRLTIEGVYQTNLKRYDEVTVFADLYQVCRLNGWQPDQFGGAEITVNDFTRVDEVEQSFIKRVNRTTDRYGETYSSATIKEVSPQTFAWLDLMDLNVWIILALMMAVAAVTMVSGLLIIILERTSMIGVLKALGARNSLVRSTFMWFAAFIIGRGLLLGDAIALGLLALQRCTGLVKLDPQTYYVSTVPIEFNWPIILALNVATLVISLVILVAPSYLVARIHPARSMRYE